MSFDHPIVELRQYTLRPGQRDTLIELFDREFVTGQEAEGMSIIGQFRDLDREDRFVWLRGFPDMASRLRSLTDFYSGECWKAHSAAANATMVDVSDVLLLHPAGPIDPPATEPDSGEPALLVATIVSLNDEGAEAFPAAFSCSIHPQLVSHGAEIVATYETDSSANDFPRLPVRGGEQVFVWVSRYSSVATHEESVRSIETSPEWSAAVQPLMARLTVGPAVTLRLEATPGSRYQP